jgi:hypothetical protein
MTLPIATPYWGQNVDALGIRRCSIDAGRASKDDDVIRIGHGLSFRSGVQEIITAPGGHIEVTQVGTA